MSISLEAYKSLPAVDKLLGNSAIKEQIDVCGRETVLFAIRKTLESQRNLIKTGTFPPKESEIIAEICETVKTIAEPSLKKVINATGVIINTNLGRSPISKKALTEAIPILSGYSNLEYDLDAATRGHRSVHLKNILCFLTGAEDIIVVNNAAAAVLLCLNTFANRKEVIVSRGELVEIGGSFRIPEVMKAAGSKMIEVGTTNKTRIADYKNAVTEKTGVIFKAHQSNFVIKGFTEHTELSELVELGNSQSIPVIYDNGSGLLNKSEFEVLKNQSDVKSAIEAGAGLVCFSGDKLLGGPQAGIIAGKKEYIAKLKKNQLLRALRVCKTTIAILEASCRQFLNKEELTRENYVFRSLSLTENQIKEKASKLCDLLSKTGIRSEIINNDAMIGGGSSPENIIKSYAVKIIPDKGNKKLNTEFAEKLYRSLLVCQNPIAGILRKGELLFDMITVDDEDLEVIMNAITNKK